MRPPEQTLGQLLQQARLSRGLRQRDIAVMLDITPRLVSSYERGERTPGGLMLGAIVLLLRDRADGPDLAPIEAFVREDLARSVAAAREQ
jgi:transcriptional regulator with XRE-family HTH domain